MGLSYLTKSFYVIWVVDSDMKSSILLECMMMNHSIIDGTHDLQVFLKFFQICVRLLWWKFGKKYWKGRVCACKLFWKYLIWPFFLLTINLRTFEKTVDMKVKGYSFTILVIFQVFFSKLASNSFLNMFEKLHKNLISLNVSLENFESVRTVTPARRKHLQTDWNFHLCFHACYQFTVFK